MPGRRVIWSVGGIEEREKGRRRGGRAEERREGRCVIVIVLR
jgi:hypothetical protein